MNKDELVANLFMINQTNQNLIKEYGEEDETNAHYGFVKKLEIQLLIW